MLQGEALKIANAIEERVNKGHPTGGITAKVETHTIRPGSTAPGAGPVAFAWYGIEITDGVRVAVLDLDDARSLLEEVEPDWDPDRLFDAIRAQGLPVEGKS
ncbi:MAG: hypothetical protein ACRDJG_11095 [Actinomycetota bacterium]